MTTARLFICCVVFMFVGFVPSYCCTYSWVLCEAERFIVYSFVCQFDVVDKLCCWVSLLTGMCTICAQEGRGNREWRKLHNEELRDFISYPILCGW